MAVDPVPPLVRVRYALYFLTPCAGSRRRWPNISARLKPIRYPYGSLRPGILLLLPAPQWRCHRACGQGRGPVSRLLAGPLGQKGPFEKAISSLEATVHLAPSSTLAAGFLAALYARSGNTGRAEELMESVREKSSGPAWRLIRGPWTSRQDVRVLAGSPGGARSLSYAILRA